MIQTIDINVDVGEGIDNESQLMPYISSCNIAYGGHAGDFQTMRTVVKLAKQNKVNIGAHPSFPDRENFGRQIMDISHKELVSSLREQIFGLIKILNEERVVLHHVKPHGALYNLATVNTAIALAIIEAMKSIPTETKLYVPYNSVIAKLAIKENIPILYEAFADRNYNDDLTLVSRKEYNAIISDSNKLFAHVHRMITQQNVKAINGVEVKINADTFCVHGDNPSAVGIVKRIRQALEKESIQVKPLGY